MADPSPVVIDMTEPSPTPSSGNAAQPADDGVVVVAAEAGEDDALPANALLQPDGSVILTLNFPVVMRWRRADSDAVREERRDTLHMHRLNGAAMRAIMNAGRGQAVPTGIAKSCRIPQAMFDKLYDMMDASDATAAAQVFSFFLSGGAPTATGQPSSP